MNGADLRTMRRAAGLTQRELADKMGITNQHLCKLERGKVRVTKLCELAALAVFTPGGSEALRLAAKRELALRRVSEIVEGSSSPVAIQIGQICEEAIATP